MQRTRTQHLQEAFDGLLQNDASAYFALFAEDLSYHSPTGETRHLPALRTQFAQWKDRLHRKKIEFSLQTLDSDDTTATDKLQQRIQLRWKKWGPLYLRWKIERQSLFYWRKNKAGAWEVYKVEVQGERRRFKGFYIALKKL